MLDKNALIQRAIAWEKAHPPNTGYTEKVFREVCRANLPNGTNLWTQIAAQFTGKDGGPIDLVSWDSPEEQVEYSLTKRWSLDQSVDCSSIWHILYRIFFGINIGTWTEEQFNVLAPKKIAWEKRRVGDHVLYNFKQSQGRKASHAANIVVPPDPKTGIGQIGHTTSKSNPFRFEADTYSRTKRVGVYRVLTDEQYKSLFVSGSSLIIPDWPTLKFGVKAPSAVKEYKRAMLKIYPKCGLTPSNSNYLESCMTVTRQFQRDISHKDEFGLPLVADGIVGSKTRYAIAVALSRL